MRERKQSHTMATAAVEKRLETIENELFQIKQQLTASLSDTSPADWEKIFGTFAESEGFEEAMRLGRGYREAQKSHEP